MKKLRRPSGLRDLGFKSYEFQLIGEIIVLCGLVEQILRDLPLYITHSDDPAAIAFTAHLNFKSLCDLNLAILDGREFDDAPFIFDESDRIIKTIKNAANLFDDRNRIVHGPFMQFEDNVKGTFRRTARGKIRFQSHPYGRDEIVKLLTRLVEVYETLQFFSLELKTDWFLRVQSPR